MTSFHRRHFLKSSLAVAVAGAAAPFADLAFGLETKTVGAGNSNLRFGLVTYMWGFDWDLPTLLSNCERTGVFGVELRTEHAHGVDPHLSEAARIEVKNRFTDSPVTLVGLGCNADFHHLDQEKLRASIDKAKAFIRLSHDVGGSGVKVKPNDLPPDVPREQTTSQIGQALNELGAYAADYGQDIRLEVHGQCSPLPVIVEIMAVVDHPRVGVCWNSNSQDLKGEGLEHNFQLVEKRLGKTVHIQPFDGNQYPTAKLIQLLQGIDYEGWLLLEASDQPSDRVAALKRQRTIFDRLADQEKCED